MRRNQWRCSREATTRWFFWLRDEGSLLPLPHSRHSQDHLTMKMTKCKSARKSHTVSWRKADLLLWDSINVLAFRSRPRTPLWEFAALPETSITAITIAFVFRQHSLSFTPIPRGGGSYASDWQTWQCCWCVLPPRSVDGSSSLRYRIRKTRRSSSPCLSDSSLHEQYRHVQKGGDIPVAGLRCSAPPRKGSQTLSSGLHSEMSDWSTGILCFRLIFQAIS